MVVESETTENKKKKIKNNLSIDFIVYNN